MLPRSFSFRRNLAALRRLARRLRRERSGIAATEFAILAPVLITLWIGLSEVTEGVMLHRKVSLLTRTLADLTAQATTVNDDGVGNIFNAASAVMLPFTSINPQMTISSIVINSSGVAKVCWSDAKYATALTAGSPITLPTALQVAGTSLIMATASYDYKPQLGSPLTGTFVVGNQPIYMRPRVGRAGGTSGAEQVGRTKSSSTTMC